MHLKNEGPESKTGPVYRWVPVGGERANGEGEYGGCTLCMYVCMKIQQ
jgi:hypothetical protein